MTDTEDDHREFMLAALRVASAKVKLMDLELTQVGIALKAKLIGPEMAVRWLHELGLMYLCEPMPGAVTRVAMQEVTAADT